MYGSMMEMKKILVLFQSIVFVLLTTPQLGYSCSRILYPNSNAMVVGRTMDWINDLYTNLVVYPRNMERDGAASGNSLTWKTKYGSVVSAAYELITTDGMNEMGLSSHILWQGDADYGTRYQKLPGLSVVMWAQFYLDNFKTVDEAIHYTEINPFQIQTFFDPPSGRYLKLHLALEDASGDSAIIEYTQGKIHIYHDRKHLVLTNRPSFDLQLKNLKQYKGFGGDKPLPGTTDPLDRFVRGAFYATHLAAPTTTNEAIRNLLSALDAVSEPFEKSTVDHEVIEPTVWSAVADMTHRIYYFKSANSLSFIWVALDKFNLNSGQPALKLIGKPEDYTGDVSGHFGHK